MPLTARMRFSGNKDINLYTHHANAQCESTSKYLISAGQGKGASNTETKALICHKRNNRKRRDLKRADSTGRNLL